MQHLPSLPQQAAAGLVQELQSFVAQLTFVKTRERRPRPRMIDFMCLILVAQGCLLRVQ